MNRVTRKDVAIRAGVTETIVSYVVNNNRYVDKEKRERVEKAIKELGYRPNPLAAALKGKASRHILFIADDLYSEYFGYITGAMEELARVDGYIISLCSDNGDPEFVQRILGWDFDGIVIGSATISTKDIQTLIDSKMPVVLLEINQYPIFNGSYGLINTGLKEGTAEAVRYLLEHGRRSIGFVSSFTEFKEEDYRYLGYKEAINGEELLLSACNAAELQTRFMELKEKTDIDALICRTDTIAAEMLLILRNMKLEVPGDIALIGFNNSRMTKYTQPSLSSIKIDRDGIAREAMGLFKRLRNGEKGIIRVNLKTEMILRNSTN